MFWLFMTMSFWLAAERAFDFVWNFNIDALFEKEISEMHCHKQPHALYHVLCRHLCAVLHIELLCTRSAHLLLIEHLGSFAY